jgi:hypothetical protein
VKYHCGHSGCDICGARMCKNDLLLEPVRYMTLNFLICHPCLSWAVNFAYTAACRLGGTILDPSKPCASDPSTDPAKESKP